MEKETGLVHIYYGDGKGKTTTGMGLIIRAAGFGYKVLLYQFMKDNHTSERKILKGMENITVIDGLEKEKFSFLMTDQEKSGRREFYGKRFREVTDRAVQEHYDVIFLDEAIYTISAGLLEETLLLDFLREKPSHLEVILTGNYPSESLLDAADYVSEIKKIKHPFDKGQSARGGIER